MDQEFPGTPGTPSTTCTNLSGQYVHHTAYQERGRSNSESTRHIDIRFFFLHDRQRTGDVEIKYLPTERMIADTLTKPLQGELFRQLGKELLNITPLTLTCAAGCKTEDRTNTIRTPARTRTNPRFPYPTPIPN